MKPTSFPAMLLSLLLLLVPLTAATRGAEFAISSTTAILLHAPTPDPANNLLDPTTQQPATNTTELGPTLRIPTKAVARSNLSNIAPRRIPDDKLAGITCGTSRHPYEGQARVKRINQGYEYLWRVGSYWTINPNHADRVSCSWESAIFLINETPNPITIAFARVADLARDIRIKCDDMANNVNGEVRDYGGSIIVVSKSNC